jgi:hypothetical protein
MIKGKDGNSVSDVARGNNHATEDSVSLEARRCNTLGLRTGERWIITIHRDRAVFSCAEPAECFTVQRWEAKEVIETDSDAWLGNPNVRVVNRSGRNFRLKRDQSLALWKWGYSVEAAIEEIKAIARVIPETVIQVRRLDGGVTEYPNSDDLRRGIVAGSVRKDHECRRVPRAEVLKKAHRGLPVLVTGRRLMAKVHGRALLVSVLVTLGLIHSIAPFGRMQREDSYMERLLLPF